jgi:hypothetical protein
MSAQGNLPPEWKSVIQIFGYEEVRGLWTNPEYFNRERHGATFNKWRNNKRSFTRNEFDNSRCIFIPEQGRTWLLDFFPGGSVRSAQLFPTDKELRGTWSVQDSGRFISGQDNINVLHIIIRVPNQFELFVVKNLETTNRGSLHHSGILKGRQGIAYCKVIKLPLPSLTITRNYSS